MHSVPLIWRCRLTWPGFGGPQCLRPPSLDSQVTVCWAGVAMGTSSMAKAKQKNRMSLVRISVLSFRLVGEDRASGQALQIREVSVRRWYHGGGWMPLKRCVNGGE